jgi:transposase
MSQKQWVGIDVSKASLDIYLRPAHQYLQVANTSVGISELLDQLSSVEVAQVIVEATGGLEQPMSIALHQSGTSVSLINARQGRDFAKATGHLAKSDHIDAQVLAHFGEALHPPVSAFASEAEQAYKTLSVAVVNSSRCSVPRRIDAVIWDK